jgi:hypothetical protein
VHEGTPERVLYEQEQWIAQKRRTLEAFDRGILLGRVSDGPVLPERDRGADREYYVKQIQEAEETFEAMNAIFAQS